MSTARKVDESAVEAFRYWEVCFGTGPIRLQPVQWRPNRAQLETSGVAMVEDRVIYRPL